MIGLGLGLHIGQRGGVRLGGGGGFVGPYDAIPSITSAYGMRRLFTTYTGNLLRLRRASDNAESDFGYLANGDLDAAAIATWLTATMGYVTTWYDQRGNGKNATQTTASSQPLYVSQAAGMTFDNIDDYFVTTIVPASGYAGFVRISGVSGNNQFVFGTKNQIFQINAFGALGHEFRYGEAKNSATAVSFTTIGMTSGGGYLDGALAVAGGNSIFTGANAIYLGARNNDGVADLFVNGDMREAIFLSASPDASGVAGIHAIMEAA